MKDSLIAIKLDSPMFFFLSCTYIHRFLLPYTYIRGTALGTAGTAVLVPEFPIILSVVGDT